MSLSLVSRRLLPVSRLPYRSLSTVPPTAQVPPPPPSQQANGSEEPYTHFKITATRSAIGLGKRYKATFEALGADDFLTTMAYTLISPLPLHRNLEADANSVYEALPRSCWKDIASEGACQGGKRDHEPSEK